ncbi:MAG: response regulator [Deltaproteobacteria bacterium]|nr:response regulator [Deltaproteobacteria bacterium]
MPTKILAIDDSKTMRLAIKITFAAEDADVTSVSKGSEAVARAKQMSADVVLVDASLAAGEPTGYEVCRALKQDAATAAIPVVLLVSNQTGVDEAQLAASGGDGWLAKPFDTQELIDKVAAVQEQAAARPAAAAAAPAPAPAAPAPVAAPPPTRPVSAPAPAAAARPNNRTQMGMPAPAGPPASVATPTPAPKPAPKPAVRPAAPARPAPRPAVAAPPPKTRPSAPSRPATGPSPVTPTPAPAAAMTKPAPAPAAMARPAAAPAGGPIPIAVPIPFTAADAPTPGMAARIQQASGAAGIDPKVAEALASLSRDVIEKIVWEVVPELAESIIRAHQAKSA